jgi:DNA-directed RNA polymerase subunit RPC12/RpoP
VILKLLIAVVAGLVIFWIGLTILRALAHGAPAPPPAGEMRKVKITYRCSICGAEVRMTAAPNEDPEPPRHCQEEMDLVAPVEE